MMETYEEMLKECIQRLETIDYYKLKKEYRKFYDLNRSLNLEESCKDDNLYDILRQILFSDRISKNIEIENQLLNVWVNYDDILDGDVIRPERRLKMAKDAIEALNKLIELDYDLTKITKE